MCGIAGKISFDGEPVSPNTVLSMLKCIHHRGPEDTGTFSQGSISLGHNRLKIIDLSDNAKQPMCNEDGTVWLVFNGEIYNYIELKQRLVDKGHSFKSSSDTEVIIHLYEEHGVECLKFLRGMYAFAIWDNRQQHLFLARDRLGQKPLKYRHTQKSFIFASELKAILADPEVAKKLDRHTIDAYLALGYVPTPYTGFEGIRKLPPAHYMIVKNGQITIHRYWKLDYGNKIVGSEDEICERIIDKLTESVKLRMISDVPLGLHLSGGVDSGAIAAIMSRMSRVPIKTFSIGYHGSHYNELDQAERTATILGTEHHPFIIQSNIVDLLPKLAWQYEEPFADVAAVAYLYLAEQTKQYVTVALNGDGGDENFGGYSKYRHILLANRFKALPAALQPLISYVLNKGSFFKPAGTLSKIIGKSNLEIYLALKKYFLASLIQTMRNDTTVDKSSIDIYQLYSKVLDDSGSANPLDKLTYLDFMTYLPDDLTPKVDIATLAFALEARSPMLDHEFVELCASIPPQYKIKNGQEKYIFRKSLEHVLPKEVTYRKKKAFILPFGDWFRTDLSNYTKSILMDSGGFVLNNVFSKTAVAALLDEHASGRQDHTFRIYNLLMLEHWSKAYGV